MPLSWTPRLYVSSPDQTLRYIATISHGKSPGEIEVEDGMGNADFNAGLKRDVAAYAYEIKELYQLNEPLALTEMQERYGATLPQRFSYVSEKMVGNIVLEDQIRLF
jgi:predicted transcriptional regulator